MHCDFALRDAKSVRETKAEPGSQGAGRDVLENISTGWGRTTAETRKWRDENIMWYCWGVRLANLNIKREDDAKRWR